MQVTDRENTNSYYFLYIPKLNWLEYNILILFHYSLSKRNPYKQYFFLKCCNLSTTLVSLTIHIWYLLFSIFLVLKKYLTEKEIKTSDLFKN